MISDDALTLRRRDAMAMLASLAALGPSLARAQTTLDRAAFLTASSLATGLPADQLTGLTDALLPLFQTQGPALLQLAALARGQGSADLAAAIRGTPMEPAAKALAAAWYTGTAGSGATATLLSYEDALAWKAAGYDAVPSQCAGEFGAWAEPPATL
jgi:hypothetical protein